MKGMKLLQGVCGGLSMLLLSTPVFAEMSLPYGWYLEANGGSSNLSGDRLPGSVSSSGIGYNANLGYKFMPYVAAEFGYTGYANSTVKNSVGTKAGTVKHYMYDVAIRGILPFYTSGFEAFAKIGAQRLSANNSVQNTTAANQLGFASSSHSATGLFFGGGVQYYIMPELAINAQWAEAQGNSTTGNSSLLSAGLSFIFG